MKQTKCVVMHSDHFEQYPGRKLEPIFYNRPFDSKLLAGVESAQLWAPPGVGISTIPEILSAMVNLHSLFASDEVDNAAWAKLSDGDLPESLEVLQISNDLRTLSWPKVTLPKLKELVAMPSIKFDAASFPSLESIHINPNKNLSNVLEALKLPIREMFLLSVPNGNKIFDVLASEDIQTIGLLGGNSLVNLDGVEQLASLKSIKLKNLSKLVDIGALKSQSELTSVNIQYCNKIENIEVLNELKKIEKLIIVGSGTMGVDRLEPRLQRVLDRSLGPDAP